MQYKFAIITMGKAEFISDDYVNVKLVDFKNPTQQRMLFIFK